MKTNSEKFYKDFDDWWGRIDFPIDIDLYCVKGGFVTKSNMNKILRAGAEGAWFDRQPEIDEAIRERRRLNNRCIEYHKEVGELKKKLAVAEEKAWKYDGLCK